MKILFTQSPLIASRLIRKITGEPVSHCAIEIDGTVIHSNFLGVHPQSAEGFRDHCTVWGEVPFPDDFKKMFEQTCAGWGRRYDFGALLYLALRYLLPWLPKKNLWQTSGMYLCSEWVSSYFGEEDAMITPYRLYLKLGGVDKKVADA